MSLRIQILVHKGYLIWFLEELSIQEFKDQYETNVFGVIRVIKEVLPTMRKKRYGLIVNISSVAGRIGFPLTSAYVSSKFALEGLSESLAYELEQFGIKVILIEPGVIKTNFVSNLKIGKGVSTTTNGYDSSYTHITEKRIAGFEPRFENGTPPIEVAKVILTAITSINVPPRDDPFKLMEIRKSKPDNEFRRCDGRSSKVGCHSKSKHQRTKRNSIQEG